MESSFTEKKEPKSRSTAKYLATPTHLESYRKMPTPTPSNISEAAPLLNPDVESPDEIVLQMREHKSPDEIFAEFGKKILCTILVV